MMDSIQYETSIMIPNTQYIRINDNVRTVAGEQTWSYRGGDIVFSEIYPIQTFKQILGEFPYLLALHCMTSQTSGKWRKVGVPSPIHGKYIWGRAEMPNNVYSPWVYITAKSEPFYAARFCAEEVLKAFSELQIKEMLTYFDKVIKNTPNYKLGQVLQQSVKEYMAKSM